MYGSICQKIDIRRALFDIKEMGYNLKPIQKIYIRKPLICHQNLTPETFKYDSL